MFQLRCQIISLFPAFQVLGTASVHVVHKVFTFLDGQVMYILTLEDIFSETQAGLVFVGDSKAFFLVPVPGHMSCNPLRVHHVALNIIPPLNIILYW